MNSDTPCLARAKVLVPITQRQLAASISMARHIADRVAITTFVVDAATSLGEHNPLSRTSAGAQRRIWTGRQLEFACFNTAALGVSCLLDALHKLPTDEPLIQEMLQAGPYRAYVYHQGDGCRIIGAVLHAKGNALLPVIKLSRRVSMQHRGRGSTLQLDLFALG